MMIRLFGMLAVTALAIGTAASINADQSIPSDAARLQLGQTPSVMTPLSPIEMVRAGTWALSESEWHRYRSLMDGVRGSVSPGTLSPIEVLGIHARNEAERQRYAERWAQMMREDAQRILAFQRAYDAAWKRLFPIEPLIDPALLPEGGSAGVDLQSSDRVLFFTRPDCAVCDRVLRRLLARIDGFAGIDIYLIELTPGDDQTARAWATQQAIAPAWVRSRRVTLNHDGGALSELTQGKGEVPYLLRRRGDILAVLSASAL